jgi:rSAM/selenodomain-associated transferase 2
MISVIIPTLNEAKYIGSTLDTVRGLQGDIEILVVDGGSDDGTAPIVLGRGCRLLHASRGRGPQLCAGAAAALGDVLWFLHADTIPAPDATERILDALRDPRVVCGNFAVRWDGDSGAARFLTLLYPQLRKIGLAYGDSGVFVRRSAYLAAGGFAMHPIFEDLDLLRRLRPLGGFVHVPSTLVTSSRRFEGRSFIRTFLRWTIMQILYWMGMNPRRLARIYAPLR